MYFLKLSRHLFKMINLDLALISNNETNYLLSHRKKTKTNLVEVFPIKIKEINRNNSFVENVN